jgi:hypothetical protein
MIATVPVARVAPSRRLWIKISIGRTSAVSEIGTSLPGNGDLDPRHIRPPGTMAARLPVQRSAIIDAGSIQELSAIRRSVSNFPPPKKS